MGIGKDESRIYVLLKGQKIMSEPQLSPMARQAIQDAFGALTKWQTICLQKNRAAKELTIPTKAIFSLMALMEVEGKDK